MPTPILPQKLKGLLAASKTSKYLVQGFSKGFKVAYCGSNKSVYSRNSRSVKDNPGAASEKVENEIALGRIAGPFNHPPFPNQVISPLALRQKRNSTKFRLLHNLSAPYDGSSVNANIPDSAAKVKYDSISQAVQLIIDNNCSFLAKSDIKGNG